MSAYMIGYVGMTHLGLNSAVAAADKGYETVCFDPDPVLIAKLSLHELPIVEPDLPKLLEKNSGRIKFTTDPSQLSLCDVVYIAPINKMSEDYVLTSGRLCQRDRPCCFDNGGSRNVE